LDIPKTGVFVENEDLSPEDQKGILKIGLSQFIEWPGLYTAQRNLLQQQVKSAAINQTIRALEIKRDVQTAYYTLWYLQNKRELWQRLDSIYSSLAEAAVLRVQTGENAGLDSIAAKARSRETSVQVHLLLRDIRTQQELLKRFVNTSDYFLPKNGPLQKVQTAFTYDSLIMHPQLQLLQQGVAIAEAELRVQRQRNKPGFEGRFFSQRLYGISPPFSGFSVSVGIPLFGRSAYKNNIRAAQIERNYQQTLLDYQRLSLSSSFNQAYQQLQKDQELLSFYETTGLSQAEAIIKAANISYRAGEISFAELSQFLTQAIDIQKNYLDVLHQYNQSAIQLNYYLNK
jgi:cobalt-zinc-cadmium resistance protein CzcA